MASVDFPSPIPPPRCLPLFDEDDITILGAFSRVQTSLHLHLRITNKSHQVMQKWSLSFGSNKFGLLPATEKLFIYLNPKEEAEVNIPLLPNRIVGGPPSTLISATLSNSVGEWKFQLDVPLELLFLLQDHASLLTEGDFSERWKRIPKENEKITTLSPPSSFFSLFSTSSETIRSHFEEHNIYVVSQHNKEDDNQGLDLSIKLLSGYGMLLKLLLHPKSSVITCKIRTAAIELCPLVFNILRKLTDDVSKKPPIPSPSLPPQTTRHQRSSVSPRSISPSSSQQTGSRTSVSPPSSGPSSTVASPSTSPSLSRVGSASLVHNQPADAPKTLQSPLSASASTLPNHPPISAIPAALSSSYPLLQPQLQQSQPSQPQAQPQSQQQQPQHHQPQPHYQSQPQHHHNQPTGVPPQLKDVKRSSSRKQLPTIPKSATQAPSQRPPAPPQRPPAPQRAISHIFEWTVDKRSGTSFIGMGLLGFVAILGSMMVTWYAYPSIDEGTIRDRLYQPVDYSLPKNHIVREAEYQTLNKTFLQREILGISVLTGPSGCGKTTAFKYLLDNRPLSLYFAMREVCDRALRIECFMRDFLAALGLGQVWGSKWLRALPSVKTIEDLRMDELRWLYITGLRTLRTVLKSKEITKYAAKLGIRPIIVIDDAQFLIDLAEEGADDDKFYGKGIIQELLNAGILISQEDSSANFVIVSNYDYSVRYFQRNYDGVQNGRLSEAEINFGDAVRDVALKYLTKRSSDLQLHLSNELALHIFDKLGGRFADLSRVPLHYPNDWINVREEELRGSINHLLETNTSSWCTHAKVVKLLRMLQRSHGYVELDVARREIDDSADLCIEQLVSQHIITRRNYGRSEDLVAIGANKQTFYLTVHSPLMHAVLADMRLVLQLKVRGSNEDESEARIIELEDIEIMELKRELANLWNTIPERIVKIKSANGRIEKNSHLLHLNHDDVLVVALASTTTPTNINTLPPAA